MKINTWFEGDKNMICKNCGKEINDNNNFCTNCGAKIKEETIIKGKNNKINIFENKKIIFLFVIIVLLIVFIIYILCNTNLLNKKNNEEFKDNYQQNIKAKIYMAVQDVYDDFKKQDVEKDVSFIEVRKYNDDLIILTLRTIPNTDFLNEIGFITVQENTYIYSRKELWCYGYTNEEEFVRDAVNLEENKRVSEKWNNTDLEYEQLSTIETSFYTDYLKNDEKTVENIKRQTSNNFSDKIFYYFGSSDTSTEILNNDTSISSNQVNNVSGEKNFNNQKSSNQYEVPYIKQNESSNNNSNNYQQDDLYQGGESRTPNNIPVQQETPKNEKTLEEKKQIAKSILDNDGNFKIVLTKGEYKDYDDTDFSDRDYTATCWVKFLYDYNNLDFDITYRTVATNTTMNETRDLMKYDEDKVFWNSMINYGQNNFTFVITDNFGNTRTVNKSIYRTSTVYTDFQ